VSVDPSELVPADPTRLVLELTEHARVGDYEHLRHALDRFRGAGVRIAVDDAGAGFASFRHILELEPDIVKVDLAISQGIHRDPARQALVGGISELARHSGATLVAEGVEEPADLDRLATLGVSIFQGYLFGRPAPLPSSGLPQAAIPAHTIGTPAHRSQRVMESRFETAVLSAAVPTAIVDLDRTATSQALADSFTASDYFQVKQRPAESDLPRLMDDLHVHGVRGYLTLNTLVFDDELAALVRALKG